MAVSGIEHRSTPASTATSKVTVSDIDQAEVVAFLGSPAAYSGASCHVERHETHGALIFLAGDRAYKIKRAVKYAYMDLSTLERRRRMVEREFAINREHASRLYLGVDTITRQRDGSLVIGGGGEPVEYELVMRRFAQSDLLSQMVERKALTVDHAVRLADTIYESHGRMRQHVTSDADNRIAIIIDGLCAQLEALGEVLFPFRCDVLRERINLQFSRAREFLRKRGEKGFVRHCHGDLHLNNIVLLDGQPTLFDALEFDDDLATIDTLYDLAFLLMDLGHAGELHLANVILNRYLRRSADPHDLEGLAAMPLFLGLRSAVRSMTSAHRAVLTEAGSKNSDVGRARSYLSDALRYLAPELPRLVAVGGLSGTGKSTLAAELASRLTPPPGALHIRTDLERKSLFHAGDTDRLPDTCYAPAVTKKVYSSVSEKARLALAAGHSVIVDATFLSSNERGEIERLAVVAGIPFLGLWLTAPAEVLVQRVASRTHDASDATPEVVMRQLASSVDDLNWNLIDARGDQELVLHAALNLLSTH